MRCGRRVALALALVLAPAAARATVEGSPHDLISQRYDVPKGEGSQERCTVCHSSARLAGPDLVHDVPPSLRGRYGAASLACFSCHDGVTLVALEVDASLTAFHPAGHGEDQAAFRALQEQGGGIPSAQGDLVGCTTCHDPHDNAHRPFLRAPLDEICLLCHSPLAGMPVEGGSANNGNHPVGRDLAAAARPGMPLRAAAEFSVPFPAAYPIRGGKGSVGTHWDLGGHLLGDKAGELACVSCHAVHGDEAAPPAPALLVRDPVGDLADEFCEACHRGRRGDDVVSGAAPNPGGTLTGRTYHPCDDDAANGAGRLVETRTPEDWPLGGGSPERLICTSCHRAHGGAAGTQLLRDPGEGRSFCEACHEGVRLEHHHPTGAAGGQCASLLAPDAAGLRTLSCENCHRAHNAGLGAPDERDFVPLLREALSTMELCTRCHPADNPTCGADRARLASHFMGDPSLQETYGDDDPPLREDPWPESGIPSRYGREGGRPSLICLSCHTFRAGAVLSGDAGDARFLLARSGNQVEWSADGEEKYLCLGCHSVNPGTGETKGHSHPTMNANVEGLGRPVSAPATVTPGGKVNCDSCHRPHEAVTKGGYYILERVDGVNEDPLTVHPRIDFTVTCHLCHDPERY